MMSAYPEHDKMHEVVGQSQTIGEFLEWLHEEKGVRLGQFHTIDTPWSDEERFDPFTYSTEKLLAEFFEIDLQKIGEEKDAMLASLRESLREANKDVTA
jgi:hypothetical protein